MVFKAHCRYNKTLPLAILLPTQTRRGLVTPATVSLSMQADNTYIIVPASNSHTTATELDLVEARWS